MRLKTTVSNLVAVITMHKFLAAVYCVFILNVLCSCLALNHQQCPSEGGCEDNQVECNWTPSIHLSPNSQRRHPHGLCWVSESHRYVYINVAKVASTTLKQLTGLPGSGRARQSKCTINPENGTVTHFQPHLGRGEYGAMQSTQGFFVFGFVRDPLERFLSGFHTVAKRGAAGGAYGDSKRMPFVRVTHDGKTQMEAFFRDVIRNGGPWEEHTAQQAYYLSHPQSKVPIAFDFLGSVELFKEDWQVLETMLDLAHVRKMPRRNPAERGATRNPMSMSDLRASSELLQLVCDVYQQDFLCLNYSMPAVCNL